VLTAVVLAVVVATVVGLIVLWPTGAAPSLEATAAEFANVDATVTDVAPVECLDPAEQMQVPCQRVSVDLTSGPDSGETAFFMKTLVDRRVERFSPGDRVILSHNPLAPEEFRYNFFEFQRETPLVLLAFLFVVVVIGFGRWKGVRALAGLVLSLGVIFVFLLPSLLRGNNAIAVALVTTSLIAFAALYLAHGISLSTTVALLGTLASVALITAMTAVVTQVAELTGLIDGSLQILAVTAEAIDPRGILIAGIVIGALGVLDDVTVTQVSAVAELRRANPSWSGRDLYRSAIRIGRDHVASTVNTLVLAYVGAGLALMLFFFQEGRAPTQVLSREIVAIEIVRMLIGSIGLVLAVPATTALAVVVAEAGNLQGHEGHSHHAVLTDPPQERIPSWDDFAPESG
jgi:uncharacterized membrane protein